MQGENPDWNSFTNLLQNFRHWEVRTLSYTSAVTRHVEMRANVRETDELTQNRHYFNDIILHAKWWGQYKMTTKNPHVSWCLPRIQAATSVMVGSTMLTLSLHGATLYGPHLRMPHAIYNGNNSYHRNKLSL